MKVHTARAEAVCTRAAAPSSRAQTSATGWAKRAQKEEWKVAGEVVDGVLITFLIQVEDVAAPGDKFVSSSPLKGIVSRVFEKGEEPFDETDHQVDYIMSPLSIVSRMTSDAFLSLWCNSVLVDLKKQVVDIYKE